MLPHFLSPAPLPTGEERNSRTETKDKSQIVSRALSQNRQQAVTTILGKSLFFFSFFLHYCPRIYTCITITVLKNNILLLN